MACSVRCGGKCCTRFPISISPATLGTRYLEVVAWRDSGGEMDPWMRDEITVAEMLIPLHEEGDEVPQYTCIHHDAQSGLCTIYEDRPAMCRDFPGYDRGGSCQHCGFTELPVGA